MAAAFICADIRRFQMSLCGASPERSHATTDKAQHQYRRWADAEHFLSAIIFSSHDFLAVIAMRLPIYGTLGFGFLVLNGPSAVDHADVSGERRTFCWEVALSPISIIVLSSK